MNCHRPNYNNNELRIQLIRAMIGIRELLSPPAKPQQKSNFESDARSANFFPVLRRLEAQILFSSKEFSHHANGKRDEMRGAEKFSVYFVSESSSRLALKTYNLLRKPCRVAMCASRFNVM
jgi:hypothetical protein